MAMACHLRKTNPIRRRGVQPHCCMPILMVSKFVLTSLRAASSSPNARAAAAANVRACLAWNSCTRMYTHPDLDAGTTEEEAIEAVRPTSAVSIFCEPGSTRAPMAGCCCCCCCCCWLLRLQPSTNGWQLLLRRLAISLLRLLGRRLLVLALLDLGELGHRDRIGLAHAVVSARHEMPDHSIFAILGSVAPTLAQPPRLHRAVFCCWAGDGIVVGRHGCQRRGT